MSDDATEPRGVWVVTWERIAVLEVFDTEAHWFWPSLWSEIRSGHARYIHDWEAFNPFVFMMDIKTVRRTIVRDREIEQIRCYAQAHMN